MFAVGRALLITEFYSWSGSVGAKTSPKKARQWGRFFEKPARCSGFMPRNGVFNTCAAHALENKEKKENEWKFQGLLVTARKGQQSC